MIKYQDNLDAIGPNQLHGFFVGWPNPPSSATLFDILCNSSHRVIAVDDQSGQVVGFVNAVSDRSLAAYIPLLEVLPNYQKRGIGSELVRRILIMLEGYYMIDLVCDEAMRPFYERCGLRPMLAMSLRNYSSQAGKR